MRLAIFLLLNAGGGYLMYYSNDYLCHYGVLGMKWGQHIFGDRGLGRASESDRSIGDGKNQAQRKRQVNSERREAKNRIAFYGGKNAAKAHIQEELNYKVDTVKSQTANGISKAIGAGILAGIGGFILGAAATGVASVAVGALVTGPAVGTYFAGVTHEIGKTTIRELEDRATRQEAYTDDMDVKGTKVKASDPDKDD